MVLHLAMYDLSSAPITYNSRVSIVTSSTVNSTLSQRPLPLTTAPMIKTVNCCFAYCLGKFFAGFYQRLQVFHDKE